MFIVSKYNFRYICIIVNNRSNSIHLKRHTTRTATCLLTRSTHCLPFSRLAQLSHLLAQSLRSRAQLLTCASTRSPVRVELFFAQRRAPAWLSPSRNAVELRQRYARATLWGSPSRKCFVDFEPVTQRWTKTTTSAEIVLKVVQSSKKFFKRYTSDLVRWVELNGSKGSNRIKTVEKPRRTQQQCGGNPTGWRSEVLCE